MNYNSSSLIWASLIAQLVKNLPAMQETWVQFLGWEAHSYMTNGKIIALTRWTFVGKVMSLLFNMLSRLVIAFVLKV